MYYITLATKSCRTFRFFTCQRWLQWLAYCAQPPWLGPLHFDAAQGSQSDQGGKRHDYRADEGGVNRTGVEGVTS